jgi:hypothetical protein
MGASDFEYKMLLTFQGRKMGRNFMPYYYSIPITSTLKNILQPTPRKITNPDILSIKEEILSALMANQHLKTFESINRMITKKFATTIHRRYGFTFWTPLKISPHQNEEP